MDSHIFQENEAYCGPAVAQMVLRRYGTEATQTDIAKELETDMVEGTSIEELEKFFARRKFTVERKNGASWSDIAPALEKGAVIVGYLEPEGEPHYALVHSVDTEAIVLSDPWHGDNFKLSKTEFVGRWIEEKEGQYGNQLLLTISR